MPMSISATAKPLAGKKRDYPEVGLALPSDWQMAGFTIGVIGRTMEGMIDVSTLMTVLGPAATPLAGLGPILATWVGAVLLHGSPGGRS